MIYNNRSDIVKAVEYPSSLRVAGYKSRLYYCTAWTLKPDFSDFLILKSYSTIVAVYQYSTGILWVFGYYSATTPQHIAKFRTWLYYEFKTGLSLPHKVNLYNDSKTGKRAARKNLEDDFASVISTALNQH